MKRYSTNRLRIKVFCLVAILLLASVVFFTVFITHKPHALWKTIANITLPPPQTALASAKFTTLPPGVILPSEKECAARVRRNTWEPRPGNETANHRVPTAQQIARLGPLPDMQPQAETIRKQITGNFTGTTDEILQWVACKWGIDEDIIRAVAVNETGWDQSGVGDDTSDQSRCPPGSGYPGAWDGSHCSESYGILQIKYHDYPGTWPMSREDTAFAAEYASAEIRACYEGWVSYLGSHYRPGDLWGCVGFWYSGRWYDKGAINYINSIKTHLANKEWLQPGF